MIAPAFLNLVTTLASRVITDRSNAYEPAVVFILSLVNCNVIFEQIRNAMQCKE